MHRKEDEQSLLYLIWLDIFGTWENKKDEYIKNISGVVWKKLIRLNFTLTYQRLASTISYASDMQGN